MIIDSADLDEKSAYKLLIGSVIPRPIAWVSTLSTEGVGNLAPISFFTVVGRKPPRISLSIQPRSDGATLKDSFVNIRDTREFVANMATLPQINGLNRSAFEFEPDVDEFDAVGLEKVPSEAVRPPRIKGAPIAFECTVEHIFSSPDGRNNVVWGNVERFYIRDDLYVGGRIDFGAIAPVGRLAAEYTLVDNAFETPIDAEVVEERAGRRMVRLDRKDTHYSPIDTDAWSPSGSTTSLD
ncbi:MULTISPECIES: flavin reductase family protein [Streptomyces]|uniref:flavin reductase family protein n=1 Tax=Streptomyces TaxID=1883 RepID=UPI0033B609CD